ncbi:ABC transporter ATP-binding protein [bacterium]|nr:MAG: ABC transporter ATP-binding protein [bacterium]
MDGSVKENIAFGLEGAEINEKKVWEALKEAHLDDFIKSIPGKINGAIGENGMKLSGGQRQRLGLARALYRDPSILVFDEATSSLDVKTERKITNEIEKLSGTRTLIIITHRISTLKNCDVIYYMNEGKIIYSGSFTQLSRLSEEFRSMDH